MEFRETGEDEHPYKLTFEVDEIEVVRAAFREFVFRLAQKGNPGSISEFDLSLADWDDETGPRSALITSYEDFAELLEDFYGSTSDAIVEIAQESVDPPFLNDYIILRHDLGKRALQLAEEIRSKAPIDPCDDEGDLDAEFSGLLGDAETADPPEA